MTTLFLGSLLAAVALAANAQQTDDQIAAQFTPPAFDRYKSTNRYTRDDRLWKTLPVDLDGTGHPDYLAVAYYDGLIAILRVIHKGKTPALAGESSDWVGCDSWPSVEAIDLDGDRKPELALNCHVGNRGTTFTSLFKWTGGAIVGLNPPHSRRPHGWTPIREANYLDLDGTGALTVLEWIGEPQSDGVANRHVDVYRLVDNRLVKAPIGLAYYRPFFAGGKREEDGKGAASVDQFRTAPGAYTLTLLNDDRDGTELRMPSSP